MLTAFIARGQQRVFRLFGVFVDDLRLAQRGLRFVTLP